MNCELLCFSDKCCSSPGWFLTEVIHFLLRMIEVGNFPFVCLFQIWKVSFFFFIVSCSFLKFGTPSFILKSNLKTAVLIILLWEAHICHVCWLLAVGTCSFKFCDLWLQALVICENPVWPELRMHLYKEAFWFFQPGPQGQQQSGNQFLC